jgi:ubiquinone/menaquinone biosynthesis C-methylase UbiE
MTGALEKQRVAEFWDAAACGEAAYALGGDDAERFEAQRAARTRLEPYIQDFADFFSGRGRRVIEIGVGMGADHMEWALAGPDRLAGVDLTPHAIDLTTRRFAVAGLASDLCVADAEALPIEDGSFDIVYSWGVLHHSPDTEKAFREVCRVLGPGGVAKIMIYHTWSLTGFMLWTRYALLRLHPLRSLRSVYAEHLESPGTKAYTAEEARELCRQAGFSSCDVSIQLNHGDLMEGEVGQRHRGLLLSVGKRLWPRALLRRFASGLGLYLMITAVKS